MKQEREYLKDKLKQAGIKSQVYTSMKKMKAAGEIHLGAVIVNGETFQRSGSKKKFVDSEGRKIREKLFERVTAFRVVIADTDEEKCETILSEFLALLDSGIAVNGNWERITVLDADWVDSDDSILKAKIAVQFIVEFEGGVYRDSKLKQAKLGDIGTK